MARINLIASIVLTLQQSVTGSATNYASAPSVEFPSLTDSATDVRRALSTVGMVSLSGVPGFAGARQASLRAGLACLPGHSQSTHQLADGTRRYTAATASDLEMPKLRGADCLRFAEEAAVLRSVVRHAVEQVIAVWQHREDGQTMNVRTSGGNQSLASAVAEAQHLEHFHVYEAIVAPGEVAGQHAALELHTDAGLLLAFTAPLYADRELDSGLWIEEAGALKQLKLQDDSLVLLVGEAARLLPFSAVPVRHALILPEEASLRAWYGLMVLLPDEVTFASGSTFGQWWKDSAQALASGDQVQLGCGSASELADLSGYGCNGTEVLCWMSCLHKSHFKLPPNTTAYGHLLPTAYGSCKTNQNAVCYGTKQHLPDGPWPDHYYEFIDETKPYNGLMFAYGAFLECTDEPVAALRMLNSCDATEETGSELIIKAGVCWPYGGLASVVWSGCQGSSAGTFQVWKGTEQSCEGQPDQQIESGGCATVSIPKPMVGLWDVMMAEGRCPISSLV